MDDELGSIEVPRGSRFAGRYVLTPGGWTGADPGAVELLDAQFSFARHPGHGGQRPGAEAIAAAAKAFGATAGYPESGAKPDPDTVY